MTLPATAKKAKGTLRPCRTNDREPMPDCHGNPVGESTMPLDDLEAFYYDDIINKLYDDTACSSDSYTVAIAARLLAWEQRLIERYRQDQERFIKLDEACNPSFNKELQQLRTRLSKRAGLPSSDLVILINTLSSLGLSPSARGKIMKAAQEEANTFNKIGTSFNGK